MSSLFIVLLYDTICKRVLYIFFGGTYYMMNRHIIPIAGFDYHGTMENKYFKLKKASDKIKAIMAFEW